jgi:thiol reductant ABC exporter CydD subunit
VDAVLLVGGGWLLATIVAGIVNGSYRSQDVAALLAVVVARGLLGAVTAVLPRRAAAAVKRELRGEVLAAATVTGHPTPTGEVVAIAGRGLDALDPYFARYLPELVRAVTVPVAVLAALLAGDLAAGLIVLATLPLIPLFGALVGAYTRQRTRRQWRVLAVLSHHFLDVVAGLPTLKVFGRARAQAATIARVTERHRVATMATLRVALLSALVLELAATLSVALVAVSVGLRLVHGGLGLQLALFLLILAPEAYLPLRRAAAEYHAASEGLAAAERAFDVLGGAGDRPAGPVAAPALDGGGGAPRSDAGGALELDRVTVRFPDRDRPALDGLDLAVPPGRVTIVIGPSGSGKSTLLRVLLGLQPPDSGVVRSPAATDRTAWLPQHPHLVAAPAVDNVRLGRPEATDEQVRVAAGRAAATGFLDVTDPARLSAGQRQRLALARVFLRTDASLVLLDEPTAHLDAATEARVVAALREFLVGRTAVIVTHRPGLLELADHVVDLTPAVLP